MSQAQQGSGGGSGAGGTGAASSALLGLGLGLGLRLDLDLEFEGRVGQQGDAADARWRDGHRVLAPAAGQVRMCVLACLCAMGGAAGEGSKMCFGGGGAAQGVARVRRWWRFAT